MLSSCSSRMLVQLVACMSLGLIAARPLPGQDGRPADTLFIYIPTVDTSRVYNLGEVLVHAGGSTTASASLIQRVSLAQIERRDAFAASDVFRLIPAAHVQTNSRGETLLYMRNAGERQVAVYFDGALLNVPWDNRVDVGLLPVSIVNGLTIAKGVPSLLYGANTIGGVVNLTSRRLEASGRFTEITSQLGTPARGRIHATHLQRRGRWSAVASVGYGASEGAPLPSGAKLPFGQEDDRLRTNSAFGLANGFGRVEVRLSDRARIGASVLHFQGNKEVPPEGHLDPAVSSVRYWKYPAWHHTLFLINGRTTLDRGGSTVLQGALWTALFGQTIDQYGSSAFRNVIYTQSDTDRTAGMRLILSRMAGRGQVRAAVNALTSIHDQGDHSLTSGMSLDRTFRQHVLSTGAEYEVDATADLAVVLGLNIDAIAAPETGDQPGRDTQAAPGWSVGATWDMPGRWRLKSLAGSRTRFPTMRELFDTALGRFVLNPDLEPERSLIGELGIDFMSEQLSGEIMAFGSSTSGSIDQTVVEVDGIRRRQRVNLQGSRLIGVEVVGRARPLSQLGVDAHATWTYGRGFDDETGRYERQLAEKPVLLGHLTTAWSPRPGLSLVLEADLFGHAHSLNENNQMEQLRGAVMLHPRVSRLVRMPTERILYAEVFARADNVTDALFVQQLGLPAPGRAFQAGIKMSI
jgi:iron complex outermembrane recepter protein